ncbi:putative inactive leucine-rich repeat receptor-like protein kinase [Carex littledalei]|uniref:Putative inactive leucine-rich repeat receptor-like protein kinase n=1 Tax=Carex littledalei TaxID=544730 RepID=A0A833VAH2_9POAL|nr:putative inactive leucine-rich repeat receptor-like protein kinase [Carex littledalei]
MPLLGATILELTLSFGNSNGLSVEPPSGDRNLLVVIPDYPPGTDLTNPVTASVTCEGGVVTELKIIGDKLDRPVRFSGYEIPNQTLSRAFVMDSFVTTLTRLTTLRVLILVSLGLWGALPDKIHRLLALEVLDLSSNFLYGSVPPKISRITGLRTLTLDNNYFNGSIPDWLDSFSNLTVLQLQSNCFNGTIPDSISKVATLTELSLSSNNLSGEIPDLSSLKKLEMLDLRVNELDSGLPGMPNGLVTLLLSKNSLTGEIPQQYASLNRLQHLDLSFNFFTGALPEGLFSLPNISYLNLGSNMLSGSLSDDLACGPQLGFVDLSMNRLFGDVPACLSSNSNSDKRTVKLGENCFSGDWQNQHDLNYCEEGNVKEKSIMMAVVIGGICFVILFFSVVFFVIFRRSCQRALSEQKLLQKPVSDNSATGFSSELLANARYISQSVKLGTQILPTYRVFSVEELKEATKNFERSSFIGEGPIGKLYKGRLENGTYVAIRCLALYKRYSIRNLKLRLDLLAKLRHPNLVCLLGHCIDGAADDTDVSRVFLVYEFVPSGTLCSYLSESILEKVIKWPDRLQVLIGIAKAVHFLHTGIIPGSANNRLKTNSVLLDEHFVAKLSDYGLSIITEEIYKRQAKREDQPIQTNSSEIARNLDDDDVYSFGLIILEVLTGPRFGRGELSNLDLLITSLSENEDVPQVLDPMVVSTCSQESLSIVISIASKCLSLEASSRPSVEEVLWNLQYAAQVQGAADGDMKSEVTSQA